MVRDEAFKQQIKGNATKKTKAKSSGKGTELPVEPRERFLSPSSDNANITEYFSMD